MANPIISGTKSPEFRNEQVTLLINSVKNNPILWDTSRSDNKSRRTRESVWAEIAMVFETRFFVSDLQAKWSNLRGQFRIKIVKKNSKQPMLCM